MKNSILLFAAVLLASATQAQITLSSGGYPGSVLGTDSLKMTTAASAFPSLIPATSGSWDLSTVTDSTPVFYAYRVNPDTSACEFADSNFYSFSGANYQGNIQSSITGSGLMEYGVFIDSATNTVSGATIYIPIQHALFSSPYTVIKFPATMSSSWSSNYQSDFNFNITYSPFYSNTPGEVKSYITEQDSVVGWGQMRVKDLTGSPSIWINVLQVQTTSTAVDSFFISGSVPSSLVLTALGITEPEVTKTYVQNYYRIGEVTPCAKVTFDSAFVTPLQATTLVKNLSTTGISNVVDNSGVRIYPNPVSGNVVSIDLPAINGAWSYELIDINGKTVTSGPLQTNGSHAQLSLPSAVTTGIYYIRLNNNDKQISVKAIDIVK